MAELTWIESSERLPDKDGWYAISYDGKTWRHGIWNMARHEFMESYDGWSLCMPKWWAIVPLPEVLA